MSKYWLIDPRLTGPCPSIFIWFNPEKMWYKTVLSIHSGKKVVIPRIRSSIFLKHDLEQFGITFSREKPSYMGDFPIQHELLSEVIRLFCDRDFKIGHNYIITSVPTSPGYIQLKFNDSAGVHKMMAILTHY
jgi:hypothetical protein